MNQHVEIEINRRYRIPRRCRCGAAPVRRKDHERHWIECSCGRRSSAYVTPTMAVMEWNKEIEMEATP